MPNFFHDLSQARELFETLAAQKGLDPFIVEKDYWVMHALWGLLQQDFKFEMKGGTSLSKGWNCIDRFSEDIDIRFEPPPDLNIGSNKKTHIDARLNFYDQLAGKIKIPGIEVTRNREFDDPEGEARNGGISLNYSSHFSPIVGLKTEVLLEVGFSQTAPNEPRDFTSWALAKALEANMEVADNRAPRIKCFNPEYTFVDKLQTICKRFRLHLERDDRPSEFLRHYYDLYKLLELDRVNSFIGTEDYDLYKEIKIRGQNALTFHSGEAFNLADNKTFQLFVQEFETVKKLIWSNVPTFQEVIERIRENSSRF